jgi:hypothetical protein
VLLNHAKILMLSWQLPDHLNRFRNLREVHKRVESMSLPPAIRHPCKKAKGAELTDRQGTYNKVIRGVHGVAERANALLKETFAALQLVSLSPTRIGAIVKAALVLLHLEHGRPPALRLHEVTIILRGKAHRSP